MLAGTRAGRASLFHVLDNIDQPRAAANLLLQRKPGRALKSVGRFVVNSTVGLAGLIDVADRIGLKRAQADLGQTLASYGVPPGAYLYVPIVGPTSVRDALGTAVESYFWPWHWLRMGQVAQRAVGLAQMTLSKPPSGPSPPAPAPAPAPSQDAYLLARAAYGEQRRPPPPDRASPTVPARPGQTVASASAPVSLLAARR
jgi:phospholipid-binding lipoprotein MlaA